MKGFTLGALLLFAVFVVAQQQGPPPYHPPPYGTPPTFPQDQQPAHPPDSKAPAPGELSNSEIQQQIQKKLGTEPGLTGTNVHATVDDGSVVLSGTIQDEQQRDLALRIAQSYAGERQIVDKIRVQQKT